MFKLSKLTTEERRKRYMRLKAKTEIRQSFLHELHEDNINTLEIWRFKYHKQTLPHLKIKWAILIGMLKAYIANKDSHDYILRVHLMKDAFENDELMVSMDT